MLDESRDRAVAWITFDRPANLNAFTVEGYHRLRVALQRHALDDTVRAVVMTGRGRAFSVGADRSLLQDTLSESDGQRAGEEFSRLLEVLADFRKPLFAAVNGLAVGFGCTVLLYCDVVMLAHTARLRLPFTALGIVPEAGSTALLPARMRWADTMWAMLSSEWMDAEAAVRAGLALRAVADADLIDEVARAATSVAALDPRSVSATKRLLTAGQFDAARQAVGRELEAMRALRSDR
jgi:enoyl-CoA hydratase/carnithine racemase